MGLVLRMSFAGLGPDDGVSAVVVRVLDDADFDVEVGDGAESAAAKGLASIIPNQS
jgi:hypothetical protein